MTFSTSMCIAAPLLAVALTACSGSSSGMLVDLVPVDAGDDCANGGVMLQSGIDANEDGTLQADEISTSEVVCNGTAGEDGDDGDDGQDASTALISQSALDEGDENCPNGGTQFDAGIDDGDPSGIANDGILQDGEIDSTEYVCNGGAGDLVDYVSVDAPMANAARTRFVLPVAQAACSTAATAATLRRTSTTAQSAAASTSTRPAKRMPIGRSRRRFKWPSVTTRSSSHRTPRFRS